MKKSKPFIQKLKIDKRVIVVYEILLSLYGYFNLPKDIAEKLDELINFIEDKYFPLPKTTKDIEIDNQEYLLLTTYRKILD